MPKVDEEISKSLVLENDKTENSRLTEILSGGE
jgi:hypothetical protein